MDGPDGAACRSEGVGVPRRTRLDYSIGGSPGLRGRAADGTLSRQPVAPAQDVSDALGAASTLGSTRGFGSFVGPARNASVVLSGPMTPGVAAANRSPGGVIVGSETSGIKCAYYVK